MTTVNYFFIRSTARGSRDEALVLSASVAEATDVVVAEHDYEAEGQL
jgi:hypothetical protein